MNHFSYDVMGKEKIRDLQQEGIRSQDFHRSGAARHTLRPGPAKLILFVLAVLGVLEMLLR